MASPANSPVLDPPREVIRGWQGALDILAQFTGVASSLVTRMEGEDLLVLVTAPERDPGLPVNSVCRSLAPAGYCNEVIRSRRLLRVTDAREDPRWEGGPAVEEGMVAYLGLPLVLPGGTLFGTLSVMDRRPRNFPRLQEALLHQTRRLVETQLSFLLLHEELTDRIRLLRSCQDELRQLRDVFPLCVRCGRIRNDEAYWAAVEEYLRVRPMAESGYAICPDCKHEDLEEADMRGEPLPFPRGLGLNGPAEA